MKSLLIKLCLTAFAVSSVGCKDGSKLFEKAAENESEKKKESSKAFDEDGLSEKTLQDFNPENLDGEKNQEADQMFMSLAEGGKSVSQDDLKIVFHDLEKEDGPDMNLHLASDDLSFEEVLKEADLVVIIVIEKDDFRRFMRAYFRLKADRMFSRFDDDGNNQLSGEEISTWLKKKAEKKFDGQVPENVAEQIELKKELILKKFSASGTFLTKEEAMKAFRVARFLGKPYHGKKFSRDLAGGEKLHGMKIKFFFKFLMHKHPVPKEKIMFIVKKWGGDDSSLSKDELITMLSEMMIKHRSELRDFLEDREDLDFNDIDESNVKDRVTEIVNKIYEALGYPDQKTIGEEDVRDFLEELRKNRHIVHLKNLFKKLKESSKLIKEDIIASLEKKSDREDQPEGEGAPVDLAGLYDEILTELSYPVAAEWTEDQFLDFVKLFRKKLTEAIFKKVDADVADGLLSKDELKKYFVHLGRRFQNHMKPGMGKHHGKPDMSEPPGDPNAPDMSKMYIEHVDKHLDEIIKIYSSQEGQNQLNLEDFSKLHRKVKSYFKVMKHGKLLDAVKIKGPGMHGKPGEPGK